MLEALKGNKKVLACKEVKAKDKFISDEVMSFCCDTDVTVGDVFVVMARGILRTVQVVDIHPLWRYSQERQGLGDPDTMSWVINKVDLDRHAMMKRARMFKRDIKAALDEQIEKAQYAKEVNDFVAKLGKDDQNHFKELYDILDALDKNPALVDEYMKK